MKSQTLSKFDNESNVLVTLAWFRAVEEVMGLRFNTIVKLTGLKEYQIQRVLRRLIKRGWVEEKQTWSSDGFRPSFDWINNKLNVKSSDRDVMTKKKFLKYFRKQILKQHVFYFLKIFPYVTGIGKLPTGTKRFWMRVSTEFKSSLNVEQLNRLRVIHSDDEFIIEEGSVITSQLLELPKGGSFDFFKSRHVIDKKVKDFKHIHEITENEELGWTCKKCHRSITPFEFEVLLRNENIIVNGKFIEARRGSNTATNS